MYLRRVGTKVDMQVRMRRVGTTVDMQVRMYECDMQVRMQTCRYIQVRNVPKTFNRTLIGVICSDDQISLIHLKLFGKVDLSLALGLVTSFNGHKTVRWRPTSCCLRSMSTGDPNKSRQGGRKSFKKFHQVPLKN